MAESRCPSWQNAGMKIKIHPLFEYLLKTTQRPPEAIIGFSLSRPPTLGDFLADLDPTMSLDWNNRSFLGLPELRQHVLRQAALQDLEIGNVLITAGAAEANYLALRQLVNAGDEVITDTPGWPQVGVLAKGIGAELIEIRRRPENAWGFPLDELASAVNERTALIFLSNPNNPTGSLLSESELLEIVSLARPHGIAVLVDEVYAGLEWSRPRSPSIAGIYERGITTGSVSKALGLQGLRTGWLVSPDQSVIRDAMVLRENASEIMNIMGETIAEIALREENLEPALRSAREAGQQNLEALDQFIMENPHLSWTPPQAGLIGLARLPDSVLSDALCQRLLGEPYNTFALPGSVYNEPQHIRVGVGGGPEANLDDGLQRLARCLHAIQPET